MRTIFLDESLAESHVDHEESLAALASSDANVIRLHIPVDVVLRVEELKALCELQTDHRDGERRELSIANIEKVFQRWSEEFHHHDIIWLFHGTVVHSREPL